MTARQFIRKCHTMTAAAILALDSIDGCRTAVVGGELYVEWEAEMYVLLPEYLRLTGHM